MPKTRQERLREYRRQEREQGLRFTIKWVTIALLISIIIWGSAWHAATQGYTP